MPSTATITAFYTFSALTQIKSSEHNANFNNFRGHLIAIDPNTATAAATLTYDLGATDKYWRVGYVGLVNANTITTTTLVATTVTVTNLSVTNISTTLSVSDTLFYLQDNSDTSKKLTFELSSITTATTRTITVADRSIAIGKYPTVQRFTSGSGTYTTPAGVTYIIVEMVGGGAGGGGSGTTSGTAATVGGNTTFGSSLLTAAGGSIGSRGGNSSAGGAATVNSPATALVAVTGGSGQGATGHGSAVGTQSSRLNGGQGGASAYGGTGGGGGISNAGGNGVTNTGGGGGGAGQDAVNSANCGSGGGAGAYIKALITNPDATYAYAVGAAGNGQAAGTSGFAGGNGGSGLIVVTEFYN
jgi:hypothetical protein